MHQTIISLLTTYRYAILFPIAALEGPVVSLAVGFLIHTGTLHFWPSYIVLILGDTIPDSFYFFLGYWGRNTKFTKRLIQKSEFFSRHFDTVERLWHNHGWATMFFGKLAYGMAPPFLASAGIVRMSFKRFITYSIPITLSQYLVFLAIGYSSGHLYKQASKYVTLAYVLLAIIVIAFIAIYFLASKYAKKKIITMEIQEKKKRY